MPCYQIRVQGMSASMQGADAGLLREALEGDGFSIRPSDGRFHFLKGAIYGVFVFADERIAIAGRREDSEEVSYIKRLYSKKVLEKTARQFGWQMKPAGQDKFRMVKGY